MAYSYWRGTLNPDAPAYPAPTPGPRLGSLGESPPTSCPYPRLHAPALRLPASPAPGSSVCGKLAERGRSGPLPLRARRGSGVREEVCAVGGQGLVPGRPSGGAGAASALGGRAGRPVAGGVRAGREDAASGPISGIPGADVAQALRRARSPPLPPGSLGCGAGEFPRCHSQPSGWPLSSTFWASVFPAWEKRTLTTTTIFSEPRDEGS